MYLLVAVVALACVTLAFLWTVRRFAMLGDHSRLDIVSFAETGTRGYRRRRAPVAVLALASVVVLSAFDVVPIAALELVVETLSPWLDQMSPFLLLLRVYALTSVLTEAVTNNAVAVILTPTGRRASQVSGLDPRSFVMAVMFAASASFATPIGYQTNTLVYAAGTYRFTDFLRVGVPMNIIVGLATCFALSTF